MSPFGQRAMIVLGMLLLLLAAYPGAGSAAPCDGVPLCETQVQGSVHYGGWDTKGWAYYCGGDHPYYWNNDSVLGFGNNFSFNNSCFTVTENPFVENSPSKMDATITNWCLKGEDITVTLGCSAQPQTAACPSNSTSSVIKDPGCPIQGSVRNTCSGGLIPVCIQTWTEQCSSGPVYCTADQAVIWCITCGS
jgi:hypothetical protein